MQHIKYELEKLVETYQNKPYLQKINKRDFIDYINSVIEVIGELPDEFDTPEGVEGLLIYLLLREKALPMEDGGEFNRQLQGTKQIFDHSIQALHNKFFPTTGEEVFEDYHAWEDGIITKLFVETGDYVINDAALFEFSRDRSTTVRPGKTWEKRDVPLLSSDYGTVTLFASLGQNIKKGELILRIRKDFSRYPK